MAVVARRSRILTAVAAVLALAGCDGAGDDSVFAVAVVGAPASPFEGGARLSSAAQMVRSATAEGLVGFDAQGRIGPGLADRWIVTDDGESYIFRLRDGTWPDGTAISAPQVATALRQALAGLRGTTLGLDLDGVAEIRSMTGRVIEIRLSRPMPDLLQLLAQPELGLLRKNRGAGPMRLKRDGDTALLTPIAPERLGLPQPADWSAGMRPVRLVALPAERAIARFAAGELELVTGGRFEDFPRAAAGAGIARGALRLDPVTGLFGLSVARSDGLLAEPETREAVAMAVDRDAIAAALGLGNGWTPTARIVPAGIPGELLGAEERWAGLSLEERRTEAAARIARWQAGAAEPAALSIGLPEGPGADALFAVLAESLKAIGIEAARAPSAGQGDLRMIDTVARYPRASWFLNQLSCSAGRGACSVVADRRAAEARAAADPATRAALMAKAEEELTLAHVFVPLGQPVRWSLVRGNPAGFAANATGHHPLMPLALRPR